MAGPITWRTVNGPSLAEASRPLQVAQQSFDGAFGLLGGALKEREAIDNANWNQTKENNTQDFLNKLYAVQGADKFKALQDSGELSQMIAANGAQIDRAAARAALDGRMGVLQQRDKQAWEFANAALDQKEAPAMDQIKGLLAQGNLEATKPLIAGLSARGQANMLGMLDARERQLVERARGDTEFGWKGAEETQKQAMRPLTLAKAQGEVDNIPLEQSRIRAQINASNASAAASNEHVLTSRATRDRIDAESEKARDLKKLGAALDGNIYKEGVYKDTDTVELAKLMKDYNVGGNGSDAGDKRSKIIERLNALSSKGITLEVKDANGKPVQTTVPLPLGAVKAALLSSTDQWHSWNGGWANTFENALKKKLEESVASGENSAANRTADDYQNYLNIMRGSAEIALTPPVKGSKKK